MLSSVLSSSSSHRRSRLQAYRSPAVLFLENPLDGDLGVLPDALVDDAVAALPEDVLRRELLRRRHEVLVAYRRRVVHPAQNRTARARLAAKTMAVVMDKIHMSRQFCVLAVEESYFTRITKTHAELP